MRLPIGRPDSRQRRAWILNLDAELELTRGLAYAPRRAVLEQVRRQVERVRLALPSEDVVIGPQTEAEGLVGTAWCPTPSALRTIAASGALVPPAPSLEVLQRANDRALSFALETLPGAREAEHADAVDRVLAAGGRWRLSRRFTFAGRGHRNVEGHLSEADRAFVNASPPVYLSPRVEIEIDVALHGMLRPAGEVERGLPTVQRVDRGQWVESRTALDGELTPDEIDRLCDAFERAADALRALGYFGPFGVDAFRYRVGNEARFHPLSEINARYSMGFPAGMGGWRATSSSR